MDDDHVALHAPPLASRQAGSWWRDLGIIHLLVKFHSSTLGMIYEKTGKNILQCTVLISSSPNGYFVHVSLFTVIVHSTVVHHMFYIYMSEHNNTLTSHCSPSSVADAIDHIAERIMAKAAEQVVDREADRTKK